MPIAAQKHTFWLVLVLVVAFSNFERTGAWTGADPLHVKPFKLLGELGSVGNAGLGVGDLGDEVNGALDGDDILIDGVHSHLYLIQKVLYAEIF